MGAVRPPNGGVTWSAGAVGYGSGGAGSAAAMQRPQTTTEQLGTKTIDGVLVTGTRTTTIIPEGAQGNDRPMTTTNETWMSKELQLPILSINQSPMSGTMTRKFANFSTAEPGAVTVHDSSGLLHRGREGELHHSVGRAVDGEGAPGYLVRAASAGASSRGQADPTSELAAERHRKAVELVEVSGSRARLVAAIPDMIEQGKAEMRKECPDCRPEFLAEWGKRMAVRFKADDFVNIAARAYEKRFTSDELSQFLAVAASQKTDKPVSPSVVLQKKLEDRLPAITGDIAAGWHRTRSQARRRSQRRDPEGTSGVQPVEGEVALAARRVITSRSIRRSRRPLIVSLNRHRRSPAVGIARSELSESSRRSASSDSMRVGRRRRFGRRPPPRGRRSPSGTRPRRRRPSPPSRGSARLPPVVVQRLIAD